MPVDLHGSDPASSSKLAAADHETLFAVAQEHLGPAGGWKLISWRVKLGKSFLEIANARGRRLIAKVSRSGKGQGAYALLRKLRDSGMRPPSLYTVVEPVLYIPEYHLLLQEKASGTQLLDLGRGEEAALWLRALQALSIDAPHADFQLNVEGLKEAVPESARLIETALSFEKVTGFVPSHGDFHPMNLYVARDRVTAIDVDTFALREPSMDVGYFLAQSAIMGYLKHTSFSATRQMREDFLRTYGSYDARRVALHAGAAFLRTLHYDFCILKIDPHQLVEPFLSCARRCLLEERIDFQD